MARTKKQVLQATARKQQLHLEAVEKAAQEAVSSSPAETPLGKKGKAESLSSPIVGLDQQLEPYDRPPGRPHKSASPRKLKPQLNQLGDKDNDASRSNHDGSLYKKIILSPKKGKIIEESQSLQPDSQVKNIEIYNSQSVGVGLTEDDHFKAAPISGPVSLKKTKLTARKSTNALKKAEARELLESLTRGDTDIPNKKAADTFDTEHSETNKDCQEPPLHRYDPEREAYSPPINTPVCITDIEIELPFSFQKGKVYRRESCPVWQPTARKTFKSSKKVSRGGVRKLAGRNLTARKTFPQNLTARKTFPRIFTARKSFPAEPLSLEELERINSGSPTSAQDVESLTVFPSIHEAVITLPRSETLPVALVCIKDIRKPETAGDDVDKLTKSLSESASDKDEKSASPRRRQTPSPRGRQTPSPRGRKSSRQNSPRRSTDKKARSPRRSPKGSKNIFEQFQTEIKEDDNVKRRMLSNSPGRTGTNKNLASTTFASAMKVLRSVSEKVDGKRKKMRNLVDLSPRKRSPRSSLSLVIPDPAGSFATAQPKNSTSPARSPRSCQKLKHDTERRSDSASPRGDRRIRSPSIKLQDNNVVYMPLVKKGKVSPKTNAPEFMLTLKKGSTKETDNMKDETKSSAVRELDFLEVCSEQIVKNIIEVTSDEDGSISAVSNIDPNLSSLTKSSSPIPSASLVVTSPTPRSSATCESKNQKSQELLDLISKVDNRIKNVVFTSLDPGPCEDDESEGSSLNTSHNSDTFAQLIEQMEAETSNTKMTNPVPKSTDEPEVDSVPPDVKCGELYRRLIGNVSDKRYVPSGSQEAHIGETTESVAVEIQKDKENFQPSGKNESGLLKKHLLGDIVPASQKAVSVMSITSKVMELTTSGSPQKSASPVESTENSEQSPVTKRVPLWKKSYKTKEPLPLNILSKAEKTSNVDKKSVFISDELENYLESSKTLSLKSQGIPDHKKETPSPNAKEEVSELKDLEPDFDEVEGVLFVSFASKDAMEAHMAVEKKNKWDKDANHLLGVSRLLAFEKEKDVSVDGDSPEHIKTKTHSLRGQHMKWKKYKRMLREEFENLKLAREKGDFYSGFRQPEKTSDITKIKGWRNKYGDSTDLTAGKLHWRTEERLLRNLQPDDIRALGMKKKRRKNVVFTHRKGTFKDIGYPVGRTSTFGQSGSPEEGDNWHMMLDEYEEPLYENNEENGSFCSDEEMKNMDWSRNLEDDSLNVSEEHLDDDMKLRPLGYAKRMQITREFANMFNWGDDELRIMKNLGGRVRNRKKKDDPTDMTNLLAEEGSPDMRKRFKVKVRKSDYIAVAVITKKMACDATCALDFGGYKPSRPGVGYTDNIITKTMEQNHVQSSSPAAMKLLKKRKATMPAQLGQKTTIPKSCVPMDMKKNSLSVDEVEDDQNDISTESKRSCDKPGCRYGCICHLCNDNPEELEPRPQESTVHVCNKEYCRLGCICDSLGAGQDIVEPQHCGKPECMIECVCSKPERRHSMGASSVGHPDEGGISSDEIPSLIPDSDLSAEGPKLEKQKEDDKSAATKTWSRHAKGDKYSNLPRRESRHRVSKNLDAITRKAMMVYETSEVYCEQSGRRKKHGDEISPASRTTISKLASPPGKQHGKGPAASKLTKRKHSASQEVVISDDEETEENASCARMTSYSSTKLTDNDLCNDPTVVHIEKASDGSAGSSVCITPGNSRPSSPGFNNQDLGRRLAMVAQKKLESSQITDSQQNLGGPPKRKPQRVYTQDYVQSAWHTQMVCLKANPRPKDMFGEGPEQEGEEIKLLEFMANCNWDNAKPNILSRVAQCLSRGVYPEPRRMVIGEFVVEILPKSDKCAIIPPELRDKLPNSMYSIRVKVMRRASERDIQKYQMRAAIAAAQLKQLQASSKPKDSVSGQSCDSASKRVFQNASYSALDVSKTVAQNFTRAVTTSMPTSTTTSSPMGISGLSRLQISHPKVSFIDPNTKGNLPGERNKTDITSFNNISSVKAHSEKDTTDMEQITVHNTETGDSISMLVEHSEKNDQAENRDADDETNRKKAKTYLSSIESNPADLITEANPKVLKATTSSSIDKLGKIPLSGSWDGNIDNLHSSADGPSTESSSAVSNEKQEDGTIDLTDDNNEQQRTKNTCSELETILVKPTKTNPKPYNRSAQKGTVTRKAIPSSVFNSLEVQTPATKKSLLTPVVSQALNAKGTTPPPPSYASKIFVPMCGPLPTAGPKFIIAGTPVPANVQAVASATGKPTKTIISTPGGKLYGPFNDINDVKMLQVKAPDGTTQPLIKLLPANSIPFVNPVVPQTKPVGPSKGASSAVPGAKQNGHQLVQSKSDGSKKTSGPRGKVLNRDRNVSDFKQKQVKKTASVGDDKNPLKTTRKRKRKPKPLAPDANDSVEKTDPVKVRETCDEVDGSSRSAALAPEGPQTAGISSKTQMMVATETKFPPTRRKSVEIQLLSGEKVLVTEGNNCDDSSGATPPPPQMTSVRGQSVLQDNRAADKENFEGEYNEAVLGGQKMVINESEKSSSQIKKLGHTAGSGGVGDGLRHARSSSLDSPASETIKTSTPISAAHKVKKMSQGFLPVKRQRSGSDSAAFADARKRIKLVSESSSPETLSLMFGGGDGPAKMTPIQKFRKRMNIPVIDISDDDSQMSNSSGNSAQGLHSLHQSEENTGDEMGAKDDGNRGKKSHRERARRQDILCMFMYLYNTLTNGEESPNEPLSRKKVLDSAIQAIVYEKGLMSELEDEMNMHKFCQRAQKRRLKNAIDHLIKKGVGYSTIMSHLANVREKEEKRLAKKRILKKIIEYGKTDQASETESETRTIDVSATKSVNKKRPSSRSPQDSVPVAPSASQTIQEKLQSNPKMRVDPDNPSQYWSENYLIEIDKEEVDEEEKEEAKGVVEDTTNPATDGVEEYQGVITGTTEDSVGVSGTMEENQMEITSTCEKYQGAVTDCAENCQEMSGSDEEYHGEINVTVETSEVSEDINVIEQVETSLILDGREVIQDSKEREITADVSQAGSDEHSGKSTTMQNSPHPGESDDILRDNSTENNEPEHGTLQRSNSEEAILQVESFIENAEKWNRDPVNQAIAFCDNECSSSEVKNVPDTLKESENFEEKTSNSDQKDLSESTKLVDNGESSSLSPEREKSEDRESIFESLLPVEVNFDDASIESVPLESRRPNSASSNDNVSEQTMYVIKNDPPREITQSEPTQVEEEEMDSCQNSLDSASGENFLICDVRGMAKDEFFCPS